jgi:hypothetical protein
MSTNIEEQEDVRVVRSRRIIVQDCDEVVVVGSIHVTVDHCELERLANSILPSGTRVLGPKD